MKKMAAPSMEVVRFGAEDIIATSEIMHWEMRYKPTHEWNYNVPVTADGKMVTATNDYSHIYAKIIDLQTEKGWSAIGNHGANGVDNGTFYYHDDGWVVYRPGTN